MNIKKFWKKHKYNIIAVTVASVSVLGTCYVGAKLSKPKSFILPEPPKLTGNALKLQENMDDVCESVAIDVANDIMQALYEEGNDEEIIEHTFSCMFPKGGDISNGLYEVKKNVSILVKDMMEDVK